MKYDHVWKIGIPLGIIVYASSFVAASVSRNRFIHDDKRPKFLGVTPAAEQKRQLEVANAYIEEQQNRAKAGSLEALDLEQALAQLEERVDLDTW
eukprot:CAMPEP_0168518454 /NCGR_PEP_ID=MMETSP0405-20121227/6719_1 /TAXON_ID=498012 /ORGANISM="Trichosphaerium sp, Strain Am-I-7 wt" /LENGTH=94 /DNA_ID=CAMNT_0008538783 /DNA_START=154 /DNA_END=435 /DNA_ORIENTATION=+